MPGPLQYGNGLKAYVVHLLVAQMLSLKRVAHSAHALIAHTLCEATLLHSVMPLHHALAHWERCAIERLTRRYAEAYCRISSYLQSMANQGYNPLVAIQIALAGDAVKNLGE